jgi:hypothetical protein
VATIFAVMRIESRTGQSIFASNWSPRRAYLPSCVVQPIFLKGVLLSPQHDSSQQINAELLQSEIDFDRVRIQWY